MSTLTPTPTVGACVGDCNGDGEVRINELILGVNIALGNAAVSACASFDCPQPLPGVFINCAVEAVNNALLGCRTTPVSPTVTATPTHTCGSAPPPPSCGPDDRVVCGPDTCSACYCETPTPQPTATSTLTAPAGGFRVIGHLASFECGGDAIPNYRVTLQPLGRSTTTGSGFFSFDEVPPGAYILDTDDFCGDFPCYADTAVTVVDRDVSVQICNDICPPPHISPASGPPGTLVGLGGRCYHFHSGRQGYVYFDDVFVGRTGNGDTIGYYGAQFTVPTDALPGPHTINLSAAPDPSGSSGMVPFLVTEDQ